MDHLKRCSTILAMAAAHEDLGPADVGELGPVLDAS
jgi:hypothetical protein